jgi:hypothetical protein
LDDFSTKPIISNHLYGTERKHKTTNTTWGPTKCHGPPSERTGPKREDEESHELGAGFVGGPPFTIESNHPRRSMGKKKTQKESLAALHCGLEHIHSGLAPNGRQKNLSNWEQAMTNPWTNKTNKHDEH